MFRRLLVSNFIFCAAYWVIHQCKTFFPDDHSPNHHYEETDMLLVNVGPHTINVEQALAFHDDGESVQIIFAAEGEDDGRYVINLDGKQADRMRAWLDRNAEGVRGNERAGFHIESEG